MDIVPKQKRSEIMSKVKNKDSRIEVLFRKELWRRGFRYSKNSGKYFGKPDIVLKKHKTVIFIDSCFWHGCKKHCRMPSSNQTYWQEKIQRNKKRDKEVNRHYRKNDWRIVRIWEHDINSSKTLQKILSNLKYEIIFTRKHLERKTRI